MIIWKKSRPNKKRLRLSRKCSFYLYNLYMLPDFNADFLRNLLNAADVPGPPKDGCYDPTAVFLLMFTQNDAPSILAVLKADNRDYLWRNQVALPGGHVNQNETPLSAAFREIEEELGIAGGQVEFIGSIGHFQTIAQKDIEVFLGIWSGNREKLKYDPREISKILEFPVFELLKIHVSSHFRRRIPDVTELTYPIDEVIIWGVTARIFHYFFELILDKVESSLRIAPDDQPDEGGNQYRQA
jgi:8-oxo-dGTP pyrophosphatase MutT (NUDIX family)